MEAVLQTQYPPRMQEEVGAASRADYSKAEMLSGSRRMSVREKPFSEVGGVNWRHRQCDRNRKW